MNIDLVGSNYFDYLLWWMCVQYKCFYGLRYEVAGGIMFRVVRPSVRTSVRLYVRLYVCTSRSCDRVI